MKTLLLWIILLAIQSWSDEIKFANECVILHEEKASDGSWGGWDYPDSLLKLGKLRYFEPIEDLVFPKEIEPDSRMDLKLRYWMLNDFCVKLRESLVEAKEAEGLRLPVDSGAGTELIRYCDSLNKCIELKVLGTDKRSLFLNDIASRKYFRVDKWFYSWSGSVRKHALVQRIRLLDEEKEKLKSRLEALEGG